MNSKKWVLQVDIESDHDCVFNEPVDWKLNEKCRGSDGYWTAI